MLRKLVKLAAKAVADAVAKDDLFEKAGERTPSAPIPPSAPVAKRTAAAPPPVVVRPPEPAPAPSVAEAPAAEAPVEAKAAPKKKPAKAKKTKVATPVEAKRPAEGCVPVDSAGLLAALLPAGKPLVVNHWATWCDPCVDELPRLVRAAAGVAGVGEFLGVSWDLFDHPGDPAAVAKKVASFADSCGVGYASVLYTGEPRELFDLLGLESELIPQTVVLAPDGSVAWRKNGVIEHDDVFPLIRAVKAAAGVAS